MARSPYSLALGPRPATPASGVRIPVAASRREAEETTIVAPPDYVARMSVDEATVIMPSPFGPDSSRTQLVQHPPETHTEPAMPPLDPFQAVAPPVPSRAPAPTTPSPVAAPRRRPPAAPPSTRTLCSAGVTPSSRPPAPRAAPDPASPRDGRHDATRPRTGRLAPLALADRRAAFAAIDLPPVSTPAGVPRPLAHRLRSLWLVRAFLRLSEVVLAVAFGGAARLGARASPGRAGPTTRSG